MRLSRRFKYFFRILTGICFGLYAGFWLLLNLPFVQDKLASVTSNELGKLLQTEVNVGHIDLGLLNRIIIEDVYLADRQGVEMLKVGRLAARFELMPLFEGRIVINSVQLLGLSARLTKDSPDAIPNFQFVIDALASKDTLKKETNLDLRINSVLIRRGKIAFDVLSEPETPGKFNSSHIGLNEFTATVSLKALKNDSLNAVVRRLSFEEQSGFSLKKLSLRALANNKKLNLSDFNINLSNTALTLDSLSIRYDSLSALPRMMDDVVYRGQLQGNIYPTDFAPFIPVLKGLDKPLNLALTFNGQGKTLTCPKLSLSDAGHLRLLADAKVLNWDAGQDMYVDGNINQLNITPEGFNYYLTNLTGSLPGIVKQLEYLHLQGKVDGYLRDMKVNTQVNTRAGQLDADLMVHSDKQYNRTYSGGLKSEDLNLGILLNDEKKLGIANFEINLNGFQYKDKSKYPESSIQGVIHSFDYSNYRYENITLDGIYKDGGFNGQLALDDENGQVHLDGNFNVAHAVSDFNLKVWVHKFRPHALNLTDKFVDSDLSLNLIADFTGSSIDDVNGHILLKDLILNAPEDQGYTLDSLKITAGKVQGKKELHISSPFLKARVHGDYKYQTIPTSVIRTLKQYIPALVTLNDSKKTPQNNFNFDLHVENTDFFKKLFFHPV